MKKAFGHKYYKWEILALLWVAFFLNQADRQIYNTLIEQISNSLSLSSAEAGFIATMFSLVFAFFVPVSGFLADRCSKKWIVCFSIFLWSLATVISGSCAGLISFIAFRSVATGMGEACFGPANYSMVAEYHDESTRSRAMSIHQTSYYLGIIVSGFLAGWIGELWGWRSAFYIFGSVGVLHAFIMMWRLRDKKKLASQLSDKVVPTQKKDTPSFKESLKLVFTNRTALSMTVGFAGLIFVLQAYLTWSTLFLMKKFEMSNAEAGFSAMFYTHIFALIGILIAGSLSDKFARSSPKYRIILQGLGLILACPFIVLMGQANELWLVYLGFAGFGFFRAFFDANTYSVLYDVIPPKYHGSSAGVFLFLGWGAGSLSPFVLGALMNYISLSLAISMLSVVWLCCSTLLFVAAKFWYMRDYERAHR